MTISSTGPAHTLAAEAEAAATLLQLLEREQTALEQADADLLTTLTAEKSLLVARMSHLAAERHRALAAVGFPASEAGMQSWLVETPDAAAVAKTWENLLSHVRNAKERNRTNGLLIGQQMNRTQAALQVLQGGGNADAFYGPNGQTAPKGGSRRLVVG